MKKQEFKNLISQKITYLDGATGSNLMKRGMPSGVCPEKWILENPDIMIQLQREFVEAGSNIIYAPTFTCNRIKLEEYHLEHKIAEYNHELVRLSKIAADGRAYVAGDLTMTGRQLEPMGTMKFEELVDVYKEQAKYLVDAGVDLFIIETMMSLQETRAALIACSEVCDLPIMVTMTFEADGRSLYGTDAITATIVLQSLGADAIGANCSTGPDKMAKIITEMKSVATVPVIAKPNAGMPALDGQGNTIYTMSTEEFADGMVIMTECGASILGGCCGTSPEYIANLVKKTKNLNLPQIEVEKKRFLTSERKTLAFGLDDNFIIVGERINPTGKKALQAQLREGKLDIVMQFAEEQEENGAKVLDINVGMSGIDEKETMLRVITEVSSQVSLPLVIDSSHTDVIEAALRIYPGRALINSISLESEKIEKLLPIAKKYGSMFILLPLSDKGLPQNLKERVSIIDEVTNKALAMGFIKEDIIVDGLVATVGANPKAARETLETVAYCKQNGLATICGLSNISFGLPERININMTFLSLAIREGLTMAIANPSQQLLVNSALATDLLLNKEGSDLNYINKMNELSEKGISVQVTSGGNDLKKATQTLSSNPSNETTFSEKTILSQIHESVIKGSKNKILDQVKIALEEKNPPTDILDTVLIPAIGIVGELFEKGKYFLPQLISSAEAMKIAVEYLEPLLLAQNGEQDMPVVVIATVKGDIHDIGKNLVALMFKNYGFKVYDLGKDVSNEKIVEAAKKYNAKIVALSALMTTTMQEMKRFISYAKEQKLEAKVMIGGAVITEDYALEIGADGYSKDAAEAVRVAKDILGIEA